MNKELEKLYEWLCINRLSLNISKTNFIVFHAKNKPILPITILINNKAIDETDHVKYLGVLIDSKLTFKKHIEELRKKISRSIGVLYKLRPFVTTKILSNVYYAIVYPFLLYGITIWGNASKTYLTPIFILQKKFVRIATYKDGFPDIPGPLEHSLPLFYQLKILTIFDIYRLQLGKMVFESINNIGPFIIKFTLASDIHTHDTKYARNGYFYNNYIRTTQYGLKCLQAEGSKLWSMIPHNIKDTLSKKAFNARFKKHMVGNYNQ